ncbi:MAG: Npt1/Npt2 family nucleotide transporter [Saprospiraceae bacterium]
MKKIYTTIKYFFFRLFDIREGEIGRALLMQLNIFLIIATLLIIKPTINALFLAQFGVESLPVVFILTAIVAGIISTYYTTLISRFSLFKTSLATLFISVTCLLIFGVALNLQLFENFILYLFYIWVAIFALFTTSQFWLIANLIFDAREAKRLFGFIGAGAIAGGIAGGYLTSTLAGQLGSKNLPFVCAALLVICIPITYFIWKNYYRPTLLEKEKTPEEKNEKIRPFQLIKQSKHLTYVACIVGISVVIAKLVDYQFSGIAAAAIPDTDLLTSFFGFWFSTINVVSLLMQLFFTRWIIANLGVRSSIYILPVSILLSVGVLIVFPELLTAAILLKMADGSIKQSINKASMELAIVPISQELKTKTKTYIDVFVDSVATGLSGLILIFLIKGLQLPLVAVSWIIVSLVFFWIYLTWKLGKEYLSSFRLKLQTLSPISKEEEVEKFFQNLPEGGWKKVLENGKEKEVLIVLKKLKKLPNDQVLESIQKLLVHPSDEVKIAAIRSLPFFEKYSTTSQVKKLLQHPKQKIKIAAFNYLLDHDVEDEIAFINKYLKSKNSRVNEAAMVSLAKSVRQNNNNELKIRLIRFLRKKIKSLHRIQKTEQLNASKIAILKVIGYARLVDYYPLLHNGIKSINPAIARNAIIAAGFTEHSSFITPLLNPLGSKQFKHCTSKALINCKKKLIPILREKYRFKEIDKKALKALPTILQKIGTQDAVNLLFEMLDKANTNNRMAILRNLNIMRSKYPDFDYHSEEVSWRVKEETDLYQKTLAMVYTQKLMQEDEETIIDAEVTAAREDLQQLLEKKLDVNLERIFGLLRLKYPPDDIYNIYQGIMSEYPDLNSSALEFLDNLLEKNTKKILMPLVENNLEDHPIDKTVEQLNLNIPEEEDYFKMLLKQKDNQIKLAALSLMKRMRNNTYLPIAKNLLKQPVQKVNKAIKKTRKAG